MVELGEYLSNKQNDVFGQDMKESDFIIPVSFSNSEFKLSDYILKENYSTEDYYDKSVFNNYPYITTNQKFIIPVKANLLGLSPFCLKIDHDFIKKDGFKQNNIDKFKNKVAKSLKVNSNNKEFVGQLKDIMVDPQELLNSPMPNESKEGIEELFSKHSFEDIKQIIIKYYKFIEDNKDQLVNKIIDFKNSDGYDKKLKSNFYLVCTFDDEYDMLNDIFYFYSKFIKIRNKGTPDYKEGVCSICGQKSITMPSSGSFVGDKLYFFNYTDNVKNSKLKLCKTCNAYMFLAEDKLKKSLTRNVMLIPKVRDSKEDDYRDFVTLLNSDNNSFKKMNRKIADTELSTKYDFDLAIYTQEQGDSYPIRRYVENYRSFLIKFNGVSSDKSNNLRGIELINNNNGSYTLNYLFNQAKKIDKENLYYYNINDIFDLERIFKNLFITIDDKKVNKLLMFNYFYQIYTEKFSDLTKLLDSKTTMLFSKYMKNIFSFIYELNFDALNKNIIDEIFLNCIMQYVKASYGDSINKYTGTIRERLNEYYMLNREFWSFKMLNKETMEKLRNKFNEYPITDTSEADNIIISIIEEDPYLKYYIIGQFIRYIDDFKRSNNYNPEVFYNFMTNVNRNNIKKLFTTEILQKNIYYIDRMSKKGKLLFKIIENNLETLFNENNLSYEDYVLTMTTGYYTDNMLKSNKKE